MPFSEPYTNQWGGNSIDPKYTGFGDPQTVENNVPAVGGITNSWTNINNVLTDDDSECLLNHASTTAPYVLPYIRMSNYGFNIPATATVVGVEAEFIKRSSFQWSYTTESEVRLAWGASASTLSADNKASLAIRPNTGNFYFGGEADTWGSVLTPAIVNSSDFGIVYRLENATVNGETARGFSSARLKVFYNVSTDGSVVLTQECAEVLINNIEDINTTAQTAEVLVTVATEDVEVTKITSEVLMSLATGGVEEDPVSYIVITT